MKINILFVIPEYSYGGTNKSLQNLITHLDKDIYDIKILSLYEDGGNYYKEIFKPWVINKSAFYHYIHDNRFTRKFLGLYKRINPKDELHWLYRFEAHYIEKKYRFDIIVAYQELLATEFVSYFKHSKKIAWVQCDYPVLIDNKRFNEDLIYYNTYNKIVCVSDTAVKSMKAYFPNITTPIISIYNTLDIEFVNKKGNEHINEFNDNNFNIISIGRITPIKGFHKIPYIVNKIKKITHKKFCWYIIGSGEQEKRLKNLIAEYSLEQDIHLLGYKDNPYPYIKKADLYVCTSDSESFSYTIAEAKTLHTPIVSNNFPVAHEVINEDTGWIINIDDSAKLLSEIIENKNNIYTNIKEKITNFEYCNQDIVRKIQKILIP